MLNTLIKIILLMAVGAITNYSVLSMQPNVDILMHPTVKAKPVDPNQSYLLWKDEYMLTPDKRITNCNLKTVGIINKTIPNVVFYQPEFWILEDGTKIPTNVDIDKYLESVGKTVIPDSTEEIK